MRKQTLDLAYGNIEYGAKSVQLIVDTFLTWHPKPRGIFTKKLADQTEAKIRRMFHVQKSTIAEIVRYSGLSPNTVRRVIRAEKSGKKYQRAFGRNKTLFNPWHYLPLLERKPGALLNGAPFKDWRLPPAILKVKSILMKRRGGDRECVDVLLAMSEHGIEAVCVACELAITEHVVSRDYILNALHRLRPTAHPQAAATPAGLTLKEEPTSNCHKYNLLLTGVTYAIH